MDAGDWRLAMFVGAIFAIALAICAWRWYFENYLPSREKQRALQNKIDPPAQPETGEATPATAPSPSPASAKNRVEEDAALLDFPWSQFAKISLTTWHNSQYQGGEGQALCALIDALRDIAYLEPGDSDQQRVENWFAKLPPDGRFCISLPDAANSIRNLIEDFAERYDATRDEREQLELIGQLFQNGRSRNSPALMAKQVANLVDRLWEFRARGDPETNTENFQAFLENYKKFFREKDAQGNVTGIENAFPALLRAALLDYVEMKSGASHSTVS